MLDVSNVDAYYGTSHILHDISFDVDEGEVVTLVGRNGAGKTTTLRSVMGLTPPESGTIRFKGTAIQGSNPHEVRRAGISWVPEDRRVFPMLTVAENLRLAAHHGDDSDGDFEAMYDRFPRLDERRNQKAGTMSGGEQQMLAIARALVGLDTDLLLLDEPSEGLAPQIVSDVADIIRELNDDGVTIMLVEQNADMALTLADRAYVIDSGAIEFEGDAAELQENRELMEQYLGVK
ncbi:ABC transporter ATP-binding protein [Haloarchaeobius sp. HRN-SO-5]|uniref:ABC transporter ATP-binding protein n=1 Tax=Haloarchaeobius sp. HRN-SO-5 TaxID=3446118 RepID=UPI003EB69F50